MRKNSSADPTLRHLRGPVITIECDACDCKSDLERRALVKRFGAGVTTRQLRRRLVFGCIRMNGEDGIDRCRARLCSAARNVDG